MLALLIIIGSLGLFMFGMKSLSDGIQKLAGERLRTFLATLTSNRFSGMLTGLGTTTLIQSSTASTVMVVGFINAGLITLSQAISLIMGSNIGTTVKALIFAYSGTKFNLEFIALIFSAIAFPMLFSSNGRIKSASQFMMGTALVFISLELMKGSIEYFDHNSTFFDFVQSFSGSGFGSITFALFVAMILTSIVQSSSAMFALTLVLSERGVISFEMAAAMVIGENIGTTITANIAAIVANREAKRAALAHTIFNVIGAIIILPVFYLVLDLLDSVVINFTQKGSPYTALEARPYALAFLHVGFNLCNMILLIGFIPQLEKLLHYIIPDREGEENNIGLEYIQSGIIGTPELAILEAKKEMLKYAKTTMRMSGMVQRLLVEQDGSEFNNLMNQIRKSETVTDHFDEEIVQFLSKLPENELSAEASARLRSMVRISGDLERIADIFFQMSKVLERKRSEKIYFTPEQRNSLTAIFKQIDASLENMMNNLSSESNTVDVEKAKSLYELILTTHDHHRDEHHASIEKGNFHIKSGQIYLDLLGGCEKTADHVYQISEALKQ